MKSLVLVLGLLAAAPAAAYADGWIKCSGPDSNCNASGAQGSSIGIGLALTGLVAYGLGRKRRRR